MKSLLFAEKGMTHLHVTNRTRMLGEYTSHYCGVRPNKNQLGYRPKYMMKTEIICSRSI